MEEKLEKLEGLIKLKKSELDGLKKELSTMELIKSIEANKLMGEIGTLIWVYDLFKGE